MWINLLWIIVAILLLVLYIYYTLSGVSRRKHVLMGILYLNGVMQREGLWERVKKEDPSFTRANFIGTLHVLKEQKLVSEDDLNGFCRLTDEGRNYLLALRD